MTRGLLKAFQRPQRSPGMAGHRNFVVVNILDNPFGVYYVGEPGSAQPEPSADIVKAPYLSTRIAAQWKGYVVRGCEPF